MSRASFVRAVLAVLFGLGSALGVVSQAGFAVIGGGIGTLVGVPGAFVELARAVLPIVVALFVLAFAIRFAIRAVRTNATFSGDIARGGKLLGATAWIAFGWIVVELLYRQLWLGWATLFGNLGASLVASSGVVALCLVIDRIVPWSRAPRGVQELGFGLVIVVGLLTAQSAWSHRGVVSHVALVPVALVGLACLASGARRVDSGPKTRMLVELGLASLLLSGPLRSLVS